MLAILNSSPLFGIWLTIATYLLAKKLYGLKQIILFTPIILAPGLIIMILLIWGMPYKVYGQGGDMIRFFVSPATVALAIPLYKHLPILKKNLRAVATGVILGSLTGVISTVMLIKYLGGSKLVMVSLAAKSSTMPIALGITEKLQGIPGLIVFAVVVTGTFGGLVGPEWLKLLRIKSRVAIGLALGTASHAGGTARSVLLGETEGSMSGVAMVLTGLVTALAAPWLVSWLVN